MDTSLRDSYTKALFDLLGARFAHKGRVFLPSTSFYDSLATDEGLTKAGYALFRWLGVKPGALNIQYGAQTASHDSNITITRDYQECPYHAGALLAKQVMQFAIVHRLQYKDAATSLLIEQATLEYGFGLLMVNGLAARSTGLTKLFHLTHGQHHHTQAFTLQDYWAEDYAREFTAYTHIHHIPAATWRDHASPQALALLGMRPSATAHQHNKPLHVTHHHRRAKHYFARTLLHAIAGSGLTVLALFLWAQYSSTQPNTTFSSETILRQQH